MLKLLFQSAHHRSVARPFPFVAVLLLVVSVATLPTPGSGQSNTSRKQPDLQPRWLPVEGVPRLVRVTPYLFRGGQPSDQGLAELKRMGISIIIDMRTGSRKSEKEEVTTLGMQYVQIPWHCPFPRDPAFAQFLKIIEDNPQKKVFVHCRLGDDRTGMAVAAYRMAEQGWSADQAMQEMQRFGFDWTHHAICPGLSGYEKSFPKRLKKEKAFQDLRGPRENSK